MAKQPDPNISDETLSTRLTIEEKARWQEVFRTAQRNADGVKRFDVIRFLLGLPVREQIASDFLSETDRVYFQTGRRAKGAGNSHPTPPHLRHAQLDTVEGRRKRRRKTSNDVK